MNNLKLICETDFHDLDIIIEQDNKNQRPKVMIRGPYIVTETRNGNGRRYITEVMVDSVKTYYDKFIKEERAVGELNHPTSVDVDYNNVCHKITNLKQDGKLWIGESQVLTGTPKGDLLAGLLMNEVKVGISTRGVGNITADKSVDQYKLIAADIVHEPSGPGCFMEGILESKNYMIDEHGNVVEIAYNNLEKNIANLPKPSDEKSAKIYEAIKSFLNDF